MLCLCSESLYQSLMSGPEGLRVEVAEPGKQGRRLQAMYAAEPGMR